MTDEKNEQTPAETVGERPPPFDPDPRLVAHIENNRRWLRYYRRGVEAARKASRARA